MGNPILDPAVGGDVLVVGTSSGDVIVTEVASGSTLESTNLNTMPIGDISVIDVDKDGRDEVLATPSERVSDKPTYALDGSTLAEKWHTDHSTSMPTAWFTKVWSGDFNSDGNLEVVIPYAASASGSRFTMQVFSGADGSLQSAIPAPSGQDTFYPTVYQDPRDSTYRLVNDRAPDGFTHYMRNYNLSNDNRLAWENTGVNTVWFDSIGTSLIDGTPRVWGGWYGRTLQVLDGDGNTKWSKSFGGSYEAQAAYAGDLRGDGTEALVIGGSYGYSGGVRLDAARLSDGTPLWTFGDPDAWWSIRPLGAVDVNADGVKEVFARTIDDGATRPGKYLAIDGSTGNRLWQVPYSVGTSMLEKAAYAYVDGDGDLDVMLAANNTIEARDGITGTLLRTYTFSSNVTAFSGMHRSAANQAPTDIALSNASVAENEPAETPVGTFSTTDPDAGDTFTYTLVAGPGSVDNGAFTIDGDQLKTAAPFDFETRNSYWIRVRTTDQGGLWYEKQFTIQVTDVAEAGLHLSLSPASGNSFLALPGQTVRVGVGVTSSPTDLIGFQLNFSNVPVAEAQLRVENWVTNAAWALVPDGALDTPGDSFVAAARLDGLSAPLELGTFDVVAPMVPGEYRLTVNYVVGGPFDTAFVGVGGPIRIEYFGDVTITVLEDVVPPEADLAAPLAGQLANQDPGYVDVRWVDPGLPASGINPTTIDVHDIAIETGGRSLSVDLVVNQGGGIWRYYYGDDGETLSDGTVRVTFVGGEVEDMVGNLNAEETETFTFDGTAPVVTSVVINGGLVDPPDVPGKGSQPTSWAVQRSDIRTLVINFSEGVSNVTPAGLELVNLGVDAPAEPDIDIPLTADQLSQAGNVLTIRFDRDQLSDGVYQLRVLPSVTDAAGNQLDGDSNGVGGDAHLLRGSSLNKFYKLTGDWNGDGAVSIFDFRTLAYWFGQTVPPAPEYGDLNGDGAVTIFDVPPFRDNFGKAVVFPVETIAIAMAGNLDAGPGNVTFAPTPSADQVEPVPSPASGSLEAMGGGFLGDISTSPSEGEVLRNVHASMPQAGADSGMERLETTVLTVPDLGLTIVGVGKGSSELDDPPLDAVAGLEWVKLGTGHNSNWEITSERDVFGPGLGVYVGAHYTNLWSDRWCGDGWYRPDGSMYWENPNHFHIPNPSDYGYEYWSWYNVCFWYDPMPQSMSSVEGRWAAKWWDQGNNAATKPYTVMYDLTNREVSGHVDPNYPYDPSDIRTVFTTDDARVYSWLRFDDYALNGTNDVKWRWFGPEGFYTEWESDIPNPGTGNWYEWYKTWCWMSIDGQYPETHPGAWHVDVYVKDEQGNYEPKFAQNFTIETGPFNGDLDLRDRGDVWLADAPGGNRVDQPVVGQQLYPHFSFECSGTGSTPVFRAQLSLDGQGIWDSFDITAQGGNRYTRWSTRPWTVTSGDQCWRVHVDVNNTVTEQDEGNNYTWRTYDIAEQNTPPVISPPFPDLALDEDSGVPAGVFTPGFTSSISEPEQTDGSVWQPVGFDGELLPAQDSTETGVRYRIFDVWGGHWTDAEKDTQPGDDVLCWAGAASNVLEWTGWGLVVGMTTSDQMFQHFQDHWTDQPGLPQYGWNWWYNGVNPANGSPGWAQIDVTGGGSFFSTLAPSEYIHTRGQGPDAQRNALADVAQYSQAGYGVALGVFGSIAHAITCWGFNYDPNLAPSDPAYYKGLWITDSDDNRNVPDGNAAPDVLHYYAVTWDAANQKYNFDAYCPGTYIGEVDGLGHREYDSLDLWEYAQDSRTPDSGLTFTIVSNTHPECGVEIETNRYLRVHPQANWHGLSDVTIRVSDGDLYSEDTLRVTVNPVNDAPVLDAIGNKSVDEETLLQFTVTAGDPNDMPSNNVTLSVTGLPAGATFDLATGVFAWTPREAQQGQYIVTFTATDDGTPNLTDSEAVTITVREVNDAPVLDAIGNKSVDEETLLQFTVTAGDPNDTPSNNVTLSVTGLPAGATFDLATGVFAWTPTEAQQGQYVVTFTATDDGTPPLDDSEDVMITVTNVAPTVRILGAPASSEEGTPLTLTADVSDPGTADTFTYAWGVTKDGEPYATGDQPTFSFTPDGEGTYQVTLTVVDDDGGLATDTVAINVTDVAEAGLHLSLLPTSGSSFPVLPGATVRVRAIVTASPEDLIGFQINLSNSAVAAGQLHLEDWVTSAAWPLVLDGTLDTPGDGFVAAARLDGVPAPLELGTFDVLAPMVPGDYLLTMDDVAGGPFDTAFVGVGGAIGVEDFGDVVITVLDDIIRPEADLAAPLARQLTNQDPGYIDIRWVDPGIPASGVNPAAIDVRDIAIHSGGRLLSVDRVVDQGDGVHRYYYRDDGEKLSDGTVTVTFVGGEVEDMLGNPNVEETETFTFDGTPPVVTSVVINSGLVDPPDVPGKGSQPTSWAVQRSEIRTLVITFNEGVSTVTPADLELVNLGVDAPTEPDIPVALTADQLSQAGNVVTIRFDRGQLPDGVYEIRVLPSVTDAAGNQLDGDGNGTEGDAYVLTGSSLNMFYVLTGDWNGDTAVSIFDFPTLTYWFEATVPPAPEYVDLNGDVGVSILDYPLFRGNFGKAVVFPVERAATATAGNLVGLVGSVSSDPEPIGDHVELVQSLSTASLDVMGGGFLPYDVNGDLQVTSDDASAIIAFIDSQVPPPAGTTELHPEYDVNGDQFCTPLDALLVIDFVNNDAGQAAEGEGGAGGSTETANNWTSSPALEALPSRLAMGLVPAKTADAPLTTTDFCVSQVGYPARSSTGGYLGWRHHGLFERHATWEAARVPRVSDGAAMDLADALDAELDAALRDIAGDIADVWTTSH